MGVVCYPKINVNILKNASLFFKLMPGASGQYNCSITDGRTVWVRCECKQKISYSNTICDYHWCNLLKITKSGCIDKCTLEVGKQPLLITGRTGLIQHQQAPYRASWLMLDTAQIWTSGGQSWTEAITLKIFLNLNQKAI